jgi:hypothetical protein
MKFLKIIILISGMLVFRIAGLNAQNLSMTEPINFLPAASTDKAIDITNFKGGFFVTWKEAGAAGNIHVCYLGKQYDTKFSQSEAVVLSSEKSAFAPVLHVAGNHLYAFWLNPDGDLKYIVNDSDTSFNTQSVHAVGLENFTKLKSGITATVVNGKIVLASHTVSKNDMVTIALETNSGVLFRPATAQVVPGKKSADYPFIVTLAGDSVVRLCYSNADGIFYTDHNTKANTWTDRIPIGTEKTNTSPAIYHVFNTTRQFYIWKGNKKDNSIYYATSNANQPPANHFNLPEYFKTAYPVSICSVDDKKFIMAFVGLDKKLYLSYFTGYNPARWMEHKLFPSKAELTLKDIVIPGSHDAGMSALNGTGGTQAGSINPCNTLTQKQNIGKQLNAGIRMFDLRVGRFKNSLYTKHSSADCMADAVGGGYGERFKDILDSVNTFLNRNKKEFLILTFSHFCETEASAKNVADTIITVLGRDRIYNNQTNDISKIKLKNLAGKVIITFDGYATADRLIDSNTMADKAQTFLNFRRAYAATNLIDKLLAKQEQFFTAMNTGTNNNDLVRLDWQLTQTSEEAALVCNDFQDEKLNPIINSVMLLTNVIKRNKSITDLSLFGNKYLPSKVNEWIKTGTINKKNKPNILYVDVAGAWITDYCIELNQTSLYN